MTFFDVECLNENMNHNEPLYRKIHAFNGSFMGILC